MNKHLTDKNTSNVNISIVIGEGKSKRFTVGLKIFTPVYLVKIFGKYFPHRCNRKT